MSVNKFFCQKCDVILLPECAQGMEGTLNALKSIVSPSLQSNMTFETPEELSWEFVEFCSEKVGIDFPLCPTCAQSTLGTLQKEHDDAKRQLKVYEEMYSKLLEDDESEINSEEESILEFEKVSKELDAAKEELESTNEFIIGLKSIHEEILDLLAKHASELAISYHNTEKANGDLDSIESRKLCLADRLNSLNRLNVLNDTCHIWFDGKFGTISGLRMGRLPNQNVDWYEINAAWGQVALLVSRIATGLNFKFSKYHIHVMGSSCRIVSEKKSYDLCSDGSYFGKRSFSSGMKAFLECLAELLRYADSRDSQMTIPYPVDGDKIGGVSIALGNDVKWTCALKFMLADLKWLLSWYVQLPTS
eukprot:TRINITY_DN12804_c0_g1_i1.p1 TRINITY_DN12804_c0_g1~~TRINITY_DN12804_c0_g1_i1.p1  ORF type:complete len:362 (-),score=74.01 TRINITY_DN12804_c0_g1_i1:126-1211(-)